MNGAAAGEDSQSFSKTLSLPTVFLMTNSLETGGSERQFIALAKSLDSDRFRSLTACIFTSACSMQKRAKSTTR